jgi:hypothetical protein
MAPGEGGTVPDKPTRTSESIIVRTDNFSNLKSLHVTTKRIEKEKKDFVELRNSSFRS